MTLTAVISAVVFFLFLAAAGYLIHQRRIRNLESLASELDLRFRPAGEKGLKIPRDCILRESEFRRGSPQVRDFLEGTTEGTSYHLFECFWIRDPDKGNTAGYPANILMFHVSDPEIPGFRLQPEHLRHRVSQVFGSQDIDFGQWSRFSRIYLLTGKDEQAIRKFFTPKLIDFFERHPNRIAEYVNGEFIYYEPTRMFGLSGFRAKKLRGLIDEGIQALAILQSEAARQHDSTTLH